MNTHLPALQVVVPLLAAPLCLLIRNAVAARLLAIGVTWVCFAISLGLLTEVQRSGPIVYEFGAWPRPLGIEYAVDLLNGFVLVIVSGVASVILPIGLGEDRVPKGREYLFYSAFVLCLGGALGVTITGDAFNVFVSLEIFSLSTYILVATGRDRRALMAAFSYLVVGSIGATFILIGIALMYQMTGTLNFQDIATRLEHVHHTRTIMVAFAFVTVGISIKLAVVPLHQWLPNTYSYSPPVVSAFLAATATKVSYYLLLRFSYTVFGATFVFTTVGLQFILMPLSLIAMFMGSLSAIYQTDFRRLLAYSSIAQIGYMTLGLSMNTELGVTAGIVHLLNHALMKGGLFLVAACVISRVGSSEIDQMRGLGARMPLTAGALVIAGLGMIGMPGTAGFISKWYLVSAALEQDLYLVVFLILLSSLLALVYVWRLVEVLYLVDAPAGAKAQEASALHLIPTWILVLGSVYFGLFTDHSLGLAAAAARQLLGGG